MESNVRTAVGAVAYTGLGWWREDASLVQHGLRLYAQAIRETNRMLQDPTEALSDAALALCRTLSLFEMFRRGPGMPDAGSSQVTDWRSHAEGTFRLLQLRGREKHTSGTGFKLYDGVRMTAVIHGVARRSPNTFTRLSWDMLNEKTLRDELFDEMSAVPELLQNFDEFTASSGETSKIEDLEQKILWGNELVERGLSVCIGLRKWESRALKLCEEASPLAGVDFQDENSTVSNAGSRIFAACKLHGYGFFFICCQYWAMCIKVYTAILQLQRQILSLTNGPGVSLATTFVPEWVDPDPYAYRIANVAAHYFEPGAGLWSAQAAIFPIGTALLYFAQSGRAGSPPFQTMANAFSDSKSGAIMRDFLESTGFYARQKSRSPG